MGQFVQYFLIVGSVIMLALGMLVLSQLKSLFKPVKLEWLRVNLVVLLASVCFALAFMAITSEIYVAAARKGVFLAIVLHLSKSLLAVLFVFNITWAVQSVPAIKRLSFVKHHSLLLLTIIASAIIIFSAINFVEHGYRFENLKTVITFGFFNACAGGLIYTALKYGEMEGKRKLDEKELELVKLNELKTKAELEALHSKINPHFLYNALNSIADLSITDGKKARHMSISLADLFRYSINYSNSNYATVKDELAMVSTYLDIEKIRFEDRLNYEIHAGEESAHFLVPRFILQPVVENAVKHALKVTGDETIIRVTAAMNGDQLVLRVCDSGPAFPVMVNPGYGLKSVFDKLELLFPGRFEVKMLNEPEKCFEIIITKPSKDEPAF